MKRIRSESVIRNEQTPFKTQILWYIVGFVAVLYFAILSGACYQEKIDFTSWLNNFTTFIIEERHFLVGFTKATPKFIAVFESIWTLGYLFYATMIKHPFRGKEYGDAKWGDAKEFSSCYQNKNDKNLVEVNFGDQKRPTKPVYVNTHNYWLAEGVYLNIDNELTSNLNILVVGPPGTGKTFRLARPVLSSLSGNFLVTDPKGELSKETGQFFEDNGYEVFVLNIESEEAMAGSIHFNPFHYLRNESDIMSLAQILFKATTDAESAKGQDPFFEQSAEMLLTDILYLMHYTYPEEEKTWSLFVELLESTMVSAKPNGKIDTSNPNGILNRFIERNEKWKKGAYTGGVPQKEDLKGFVDINKIYNSAHETAASIVASLDAHCRYMKLDCVKELLSYDEIKIRDSFGYGKKTSFSPSGKRILYIVTSEDKRYYDWITSMVYSLFFDELYHITSIDPALHNTLPNHLTFLMDEFSNITLPDSFVEKLSTMRSRGMSAIVIVQNLMQLKRKFPNSDMDKDLIGNMAVIDVLGAPDQDSCEYLSKHFGTMTIHKQTTGLSKGSHGQHSENEDVMQMPLFSAEKMFRMTKDGPCAIVVKGSDPLYVNKCRFELSPLYPLLTRKTPYQQKKRYQPQARIDYHTSLCLQLPEILVGKEAEDYLRKCKEEGIKVARLTEENIDDLCVLERKAKEIPGRDASTKAFWEQVHKNSKKALMEEAENTLNLTSYTREELMVVQELKNAGFSVKQIRAVEVLIKEGKDFSYLQRFFNPNMPVKEMEEFSSVLCGQTKE